VPRTEGKGRGEAKMGNLLQIYHTNDLHNHKGALDYLQKAGIPAGSALLLDAGDAIAGSNTAFWWDEPILKQMSELGYNAMALGNREWNYIPKVVALRSRLINFPFIATNVQDPRSPEAYWQSYHVLDYGGMKIGILGLSPVQYKVGTWLEKIFKVKFLSPEKALQEILPEVREQAELIICLSHLGVEKDKALAAQFPQIPLWLGGHSHLVLEEAIKINSSYIMQAGYWGKWVGKIEFEWADKSFKNFNYKLIKTHE
jgi:5'-nucleotidase / UDP-sugar diphosphatase